MLLHIRVLPFKHSASSVRLLSARYANALRPFATAAENAKKNIPVGSLGMVLTHPSDCRSQRCGLRYTHSETLRKAALRPEAHHKLAVFRDYRQARRARYRPRVSFPPMPHS